MTEMVPLTRSSLYVSGETICEKSLFKAVLASLFVQNRVHPSLIRPPPETTTTPEHNVVSVH